VINRSSACLRVELCTHPPSFPHEFNHIADVSYALSPQSIQQGTVSWLKSVPVSVGDLLPHCNLGYLYMSPGFILLDLNCEYALFNVGLAYSCSISANLSINFNASGMSHSFKPQCCIHPNLDGWLSTPHASGPSGVAAVLIPSLR
jgi:hypothetical protein